MYFKFQCLCLIYYLFCVSEIMSKPFGMAQDLEIISSCNATHVITKDELNRSLIEKKFSGNLTSSFKCFLNCLYVKYDWLTESGIFKIKNIKSNLSDSSLTSPQIDHILSHCTKLGSLEPCEGAFQFTSCFWNQTKVLERSNSEELSSQFKVS